MKANSGWRAFVRSIAGKLRGKRPRLAFILALCSPLLLLSCVSTREQVWKQKQPRQWQWADFCKDSVLLSAVVYRPQDAEGKKVIEPLENRLKLDGWKRLGSCDRQEAPGKGLYFEVWENRRFKPRKVIFAFRGTNFTSGLDWEANLRWFRLSRAAPDRYVIARAECLRLIDSIYTAEPDNPPEIITTGHSLGGGIAQGIFYARAMKVDHCVAFDPSPVTGYYDLDLEVRNQYEERQYRPLFPPYRVVRAYERGEVLAYVRNILGAFYKPSNLTHAIEFQSKKRGGAIGQHSIVMLANTMLDAADHRPDVKDEVIQGVVDLPNAAYRPDQ